MMKFTKTTAGAAAAAVLTVFAGVASAQFGGQPSGNQAPANWKKGPQALTHPEGSFAVAVEDKGKNRKKSYDGGVYSTQVEVSLPFRNPKDKEGVVATHDKGGFRLRLVLEASATGAEANGSYRLPSESLLLFGLEPVIRDAVAKKASAADCDGIKPALADKIAKALRKDFDDHAERAQGHPVRVADAYVICTPPAPRDPDVVASEQAKLDAQKAAKEAQKAAEKAEKERRKNESREDDKSSSPSDPQEPLFPPIENSGGGFGPGGGFPSISAPRP